MTSLSGSSGLSLADVASDTIASLWVKVYASLPDEEIGRSLLVCKAFKDFLPPLIKEIYYSSPHLTQKSFERLATTFANLEKLSIHQKYDDDLPMLDWSKVRLPLLRDLSLSCCPVKSIEFNQMNTPLLESLYIENQGPEAAAKFKLDLPHLQTANFEHTHVDNGDWFGSSLTACPKLKEFSAYKLWGIGSSKQKLRLPECTTLALYRSDDLAYLEVWAPKLTYLNLQACYGLDHVRLHPKEGSSVKVNLENANIDRISLRHLEQHPRVDAERLSHDEDYEHEDDLLPGPNMPMMGAGDYADVLGHMMGNPNIMGNPMSAQVAQMLAMLQAGGLHGGMPSDEDDVLYV